MLRTRRYRRRINPKGELQKRRENIAYFKKSMMQIVNLTQKVNTLAAKVKAFTGVEQILGTAITTNTRGSMSVISKISVSVLLASALMAGCGGGATPAQPQFELRDFAVTEEKKDATQYSKEMNTFTGKGTLVARNVDKSRNMIALLEVRDETKGPNSEPEKIGVLVRGGIGKIELAKTKYNEISLPPKYQWSVIGWYELHPATIEVPGATAK